MKKKMKKKYENLSLTHCFSLPLSCCLFFLLLSRGEDHIEACLLPKQLKRNRESDRKEQRFFLLIWLSVFFFQSIDRMTTTPAKACSSSKDAALGAAFARLQGALEGSSKGGLKAVEESKEENREKKRARSKARGAIEIATPSQDRLLTFL